LADVIIGDPIHAIENSIHPIVLKIAPSKKVGITVATQVKDGIYYDRHSKDLFLLLDVEIFGHLQ
jgi:hypothetical protein